MCQLPDGSDGLCCKIKNGGKTGSAVNPLIEDLVIRNNNNNGFLSIRGEPPFNEFEIRTAAEIGQSFADNVTRSSRKTLKKTNLHAQNQRQSPGIDGLNKASLAFTGALRNLISDRGTTTNNFDVRQLFFVEFDNSVLNGKCKRDDQFDCTKARRSKYRNIDGSCNNLRKPKVGIKWENWF